MYHPLMLAFGKTYTGNFPLILVVGREPNNGTISDNSPGFYVFETKEQRRCAFWNTSFKLFGEFNGLATREMKQKFFEVGSSPIVFTDASAQGIPNKVTTKETTRRQLIKEDFYDQVDAIFANEDILKRVKLIFLSGLTSPVYNDFKQKINQRALISNIPIKEISFLIGYNYKKIMTEITQSEINILQNVFLSYDKKATHNKSIATSGAGH